MAASMWGMNGLCRSMTGVLLLWALLFSNMVMCQDDSSVAPTPLVNTAATDSAANPATADPSDQGASQGVESSGDAGAPTAAPAVVTSGGSNDQQGATSQSPPDVDAVTEKFEPVAPEVECVGEGMIPEENAIKMEVTATKDCEETKRIIEENPTKWCNSKSCNLQIFQNKNNVMLTSSDAKLASLAGALDSEALKGKLGLKKYDLPPSSDSSVFVGILVTGLLAALGIIVGYFKCQRRPDTKGAKLAEEAYPVDQENQGNTLASEAPLNPPPETQEKPSVNGESLEVVKTETSPPTNGHSTAKTADTEL